MMENKNIDNMNIENMNIENMKIDNNEMEEVTGGEYDSGVKSSPFYNYWIFDEKGHYVDDIYSRDSAVECARAHNGFIVSGSQTSGKTCPNWRHKVNHKCIFASDGFIAAKPNLTPHYDD